MREILFRGKRTCNNEWVEGGFHSRFGKAYIIGISKTERIDGTEVIPETVGQYTGLTDKHGKKIFEGDIILFEDESPTNYEYHDCTEMRCGEVRLDDGEFHLTNRIAVEMGDLIYDGKLDGVIIGNIHDNPELLKGK